MINKCHTITISLNGNSIEALIDSGSMTNIIREEFVKDCRITQTKTRLRSAGRSYLRTAGECVLRIDVNEQVIPTSFVVCEKLEAKCILGMPFLWENKVTMKFGDTCSMEFGPEKTSQLGYHRVITTTNKPVMTPLYKLGLQAENEASKIIRVYLRDDIIRPSNSPWRSPIVMVKKKDGSYRLCVDYRRLNDVTVKDAYPMPRTDEFFDALEGATIFSKLYAKSGYHQIDMYPTDIGKTAFGCREGLYEFLKMPFGLVNGLATFKRIMNNILREFINKCVVVYMDDILVYSRSEEDHVRDVSRVLEVLKEKGLILNKEKCEFGKRKLRCWDM